MLDPERIRQDPDRVRIAAKNKKFDVDVDGFIACDKERKKIIQHVEALKAKRNLITSTISQSQDKESRMTLIEDARKLRDEINAQAPILSEVEQRWKNILLTIPAIPSESSPIGKSDSDNVELSRWGSIPDLHDVPDSHLDICKRFQLADFEAGARTSGSKMTFLRGAGALLELAVLRFTIDYLIEKGWLLITPPVMVRREAMLGTGYFPGGEEQAYEIQKDELFLAGTSEVPICAMHQDQILDSSSLPRRYAGISSCFRREAGTYGRDTQGFYRIHQFQKVEQVVIGPADEEWSNETHKEILRNSQDILEQLELPYRTVAVCTGDLGLGQVYKTDLEVWMPSRKSYGETHSCSTFHTYQSRRLNLRYRESGKTSFCHTLNNTAIASPRILIPLLEINQQKNGEIKIPKKLQPYLYGNSTIPF